MSSIQNVSAEELAKVFHHYQDALAGDFECNSGEQVSSSWEQTPANERKLMIAAARLTLLELAAGSQEQNSRSKYFAKPGEAEWGC